MRINQNVKIPFLLFPFSLFFFFKLNLLIFLLGSHVGHTKEEVDESEKILSTWL